MNQTPEPSNPKSQIPRFLPVMSDTLVLLEQFGFPVTPGDPKPDRQFAALDVLRLIFLLSHPTAESSRLAQDGEFDAAVMVMAAQIPIDQLAPVAEAAVAHLMTEFGAPAEIPNLNPSTCHLNPEH